MNRTNTQPKLAVITNQKFSTISNASSKEKKQASGTILMTYLVGAQSLSKIDFTNATEVSALVGEGSATPVEVLLTAMKYMCETQASQDVISWIDRLAKEVSGVMPAEDMCSEVFEELDAVLPCAKTTLTLV
jgi:hypothetical protein